MRTEELIRYERMRQALKQLTGADLLVIVSGNEARDIRRDSKARRSRESTLRTAISKRDPT